MNSPSQTHMNAVQMTHRLVRSGHIFFKTTSLLEARGVHVPKQNAIVATVVVTFALGPAAHRVTHRAEGVTEGQDCAHGCVSGRGL